MKIQKRLAALVLTIVVVLTLCVQAFAATSPTGGPSGYQDNNERDHNGKMVVSVFNKKFTRGRVIDVTGYTGGDKTYSVSFKIARDAKQKAVPIQFIGSGSKGVFNSTQGRLVTEVVIRSGVKVHVLKQAFRGSNVKTIKIQSPTTFYENAFTSTKAQGVTFKIDGKGIDGYMMKSTDIVFRAASMKGLNTKASKFIVYGSRMTETEYNKLKTKLTKQGFQGSFIYYKTK